jgi:hypothetical protein
MKAVVLYHPRSDHGGIVEDFARDYKLAKHKELKLYSLETVEGAETAKLYDVTSYPAVLVATTDGQLQKLWQGLIEKVDQGSVSMTARRLLTACRTSATR